jgi:hypothetical protein
MGGSVGDVLGWNGVSRCASRQLFAYSFDSLSDGCYREWEEYANGRFVGDVLG